MIACRLEDKDGRGPFCQMDTLPARTRAMLRAHTNEPGRSLHAWLENLGLEGYVAGAYLSGCESRPALQTYFGRTLEPLLALGFAVRFYEVSIAIVVPGQLGWLPMYGHRIGDAQPKPIPGEWFDTFTRARDEARARRRAEAAHKEEPDAVPGS